MIKKILFIPFLFLFASPLIGGVVSDRVGVGNVSNPTDLEVSGRVTASSFTMTTNAVDGYIIISDADGNGTWQVPYGFALLASTNTWTGGNTWLLPSTMTTLAVDTISHNSKLITIANDGNDVVTSGTGNVGIGTITPQKKLDVEGAIVSKQNTATLNGTATTIDVADCNSVSLTVNSSTNLNGFTNGVAGQTVCIFNTSTTNNVVLVNQNATGTGITTGTGGNVTVTAEGGAVFTFDGTYWYMVGLQQ
ncbi:hypothetical protein ACFL58_00875 [Elusimicrobiota bacterium]